MVLELSLHRLIEDLLTKKEVDSEVLKVFEKVNVDFYDYDKLMFSKKFGDFNVKTQTGERNYKELNPIEEKLKEHLDEILEALRKDFNKGRISLKVEVPYVLLEDLKGLEELCDAVTESECVKDSELFMRELVIAYLIFRRKLKDVKKILSP